MTRRGIAGPALVELTIVALIIVVLVVIIGISRTSFVDTIYCTGGTDAGGELVCKSKVEGCGDAGNYYLGFLGCGEGQTCCKTGVKAGTPAPTSNSNTPPAPPAEEITRLAPTDFEITDTATKRPVSENSVTTLYVGNDRTFTMDLEIPKCTGCNWTYEEVHSTKSGVVVFNETPVNITTKDIEAELEKRFSSIELDASSKYVGETITVRILLTPWRRVKDGTEVKTIEGTTQHFTFRYKVESPVKIQGLSSQWSQKKTVLVTCGPDIQCSDIFYRLMTADEVESNGGECLMPPQGENVEPHTIRSTYCQVIDGVLTNCEFVTESACNLQNDQNANQPMNEAQLALQTGIENNLLPENLVPLFNQFSALEPESSSYICQLETNLNDAELAKRNFIKPNATFNDQSQQGVIELDRDFMSGTYLCVYGRDKLDKNKYYVAGKPQELKIDRVPPVAEVRFYPSTLRLTFGCEDKLSGCKEGYWTAYVSEVTKFFPALMSKGGQNAAAWCPSYKTATGYRIQTSREVIYRSNEVRVLCLRVEDNAGNAGISKVTVYNSYQMAAEILREAMD